MESSQLWLDQDGKKCSESEYLLSNKEGSDGMIYIRDGKEASTLRKVCVHISCMVQLFMCTGGGYGLSVMFPELVRVFNADRTSAALVQSLNMGVNLACGIFLTVMIKKIGPGISIMVGSVLACLGLFASAFATDMSTIIVCTGALTGIAMGLCQLSAFLTVGWFFHSDPGIYLILLTIGISLGQLTFPSVYEVFISDYGWSGAFILVSGITLNCLPFGLIIHLSNDYYITESKKSKRDKSVTLCHVSLFTDIVLWILWINGLLLGQTGNIEPWFLVDHMISRGFTRSEGATAVSVMGGGNLVGKVIGTAIKFRCKNTPTLYHWVYLGIVLAGLHALIISLYDFWALVFSCAVFGCVVGLLWAQVATIMFEASDLDRYPQAFAVLELMIGIGDVIGALSGGYIKDTYGAYDIDFFIAVGASLYISFSTGVAVFITKKRV